LKREVAFVLTLMFSYVVGTSRIVRIGLFHFQAKWHTTSLKLSLVITLSAGAMAKYCDEHVYLSVCLSGCL